jgi:hypothetical protein
MCADENPGPLSVQPGSLSLGGIGGRGYIFRYPILFPYVHLQQNFLMFHCSVYQAGAVKGKSKRNLRASFLIVSLGDMLLEAFF